jgi:glucose uptake protein GlcU
MMTNDDQGEYDSINISVGLQHSFSLKIQEATILLAKNCFRELGRIHVHCYSKCIYRCLSVALLHVVARPCTRTFGDGNLFFFLSKEESGVAVAAVFTSIAPVTTVIYAALLLGERVSARQALGIALAGGATFAIALGGVA